MNPIQQLNQAGQSIWYDNIQRSLLQNGTLAEMIANGEVRGVTSNPAIFQKAITSSHDYDASLQPLVEAGLSAEAIFWNLAVEDIRSATDLFAALYEEAKGGDGNVSLEVNPRLAYDTAATAAEAKRLWKLVDRPNLMIKIPATKEGVPAIAEAIASGVNVNVTLIFSLERYADVIDAYLTGLERRVQAGQPVDRVSSVASFFVSRVDTKIDPMLEAIAKEGGSRGEIAKRLLGKAAIANAKLAYALALEKFAAPRFQALKAKGARVQRPLWASTSTKNPAYRDVIYVEELIGPDTVNTVHPWTLAEFRDHGIVRMSLGEDLPGARQSLEDLKGLGISMDAVTAGLEQEGVKAFADAYTALLASLEEQRARLAA